MASPYKLSSCKECPHLVVSGIACDWQPHECPIHKEKTQHRKGASTKAFFLSNLMIADDFDAVRSSN